MKRTIGAAMALVAGVTSAAPSAYELERAQRGAAAVVDLEKSSGAGSTLSGRFYLFTLKREVSATEISAAVDGTGARLTALHVCPDSAGVMAFYVGAGGMTRQEMEDLPRQAFEALRASRSALREVSGAGSSASDPQSGGARTDERRVDGFCGVEATGSVRSLRQLREAISDVTFAVEITETRFRLLPMNVIGRKP